MPGSQGAGSRRPSAYAWCASVSSRRESWSNARTPEWCSSCLATRCLMSARLARMLRRLYSKIATSTPPRESSRSPKLSAGPTSVLPPSSPTSPNESTQRWTRLSGTARRFLASCRCRGALISHSPSRGESNQPDVSEICLFAAPSGSGRCGWRSHRSTGQVLQGVAHRVLRWDVAVAARVGMIIGESR